MSRKKTFDEFINEYRKKYINSDYIFDEATFVNSHTKMRVICPKHGEFWKEPKGMMIYHCPQCANENRGKSNRLTTELFIDKAKKIHGEKYDYSLVKYEKTKTPISIICPFHGEFKQKPNDHLNGKGCPKCNNSHLENEVENFLLENKILFFPHYHFKWLGRQHLDFYIPSLNIAIECQGKQHFGYGGWSKKYDFQKIKELDNKKFSLCKENGLTLYYYVGKNFKYKISEENTIYNKNVIYNLIEIKEI